MHYFIYSDFPLGKDPKFKAIEKLIDRTNKIKEIILGSDKGKMSELNSILINEFLLKTTHLIIEVQLTSYLKETEDIQKQLYELKNKYQYHLDKLNDEDIGKLEEIEKAIENIIFFVYKETKVRMCFKIHIKSKILRDLISKFVLDFSSYFMIFGNLNY